MTNNPYYDQDFFSFLWIFIQRLFGFMTGQLGLASIAVDEVQIGVLSLVAVSSALIGTFLVLRRMTMLANALSHTILLGIVIAFLLTNAHTNEASQHLGGLNIQAMLIAAVVTGLGTAFLTQFFTTTIGLQEDASTGLVFNVLFALGIVLVTLFTRNSHIGVEAIMGNVDALQVSDLNLVFVILILNLVVLGAFYKEFKITTFDPLLSQALGISVGLFNYLLMLQVSITSIGAFRAVGVIMVLALMTGPPLTARLLAHRLGRLLWVATGLGVLAAIFGVALARHMLTMFDLALSTAGLVVCVVVLFFIVALLWNSFKWLRRPV